MGFWNRKKKEEKSDRTIGEDLYRDVMQIETQVKEILAKYGHKVTVNFMIQSPYGGASIIVGDGATLKKMYVRSIAEQKDLANVMLDALKESSGFGDMNPDEMISSILKKTGVKNTKIMPIDMKDMENMSEEDIDNIINNIMKSIHKDDKGKNKD